MQIIIGSEIKITLSVKPIGGYFLKDYDFEVEFFTTTDSPRVTIPKSDCIAVEDSNDYLCVVDTTSLESGTLNALITAYIPDGDCADGLRTERALYKFEDIRLVEV